MTRLNLQRKIMFQKSLIAIIICLLAISAIACQNQNKNRYEAQFLKLFDTVTQVVSYMEKKEVFENQVKAIYDDLEKYHRYYDIYKEYDGIKNIRSINQMAGKQPVKVDRPIINLLLYGKEIYKMTHGEVNIALGAVLSIWHEYRDTGILNPEQAQLPSDNMLKEAAKHTDINKIIINEKKSTVFLDDGYMSIDVGAIAKGYALAQVTKKAIERGFTSGLISVGGNVSIIGEKDLMGTPWNVGIQNPEIDEGDNRNIFVLALKDCSLVTSGNYRRYYTVNGKKYHHIIDPDTLYPAQYFSSVSVIDNHSGQADGLSTAIYNMPLDQGLELIENLPDTEAFWLLPDGERRFSSGFQKYLKKEK